MLFKMSVNTNKERSAESWFSTERLQVYASSFSNIPAYSETLLEFALTSIVQNQMVPKQQLQLKDNFKCHWEMALNKFFPVPRGEDGAFMLSVHTGEQKTTSSTAAGLFPFVWLGTEMSWEHRYSNKCIYHVSTGT